MAAPSLIPKKTGVRIKTDGRDALKLACLLRARQLTAVWIPDTDQEAMRDLTCARYDVKGQERKARRGTSMPFVLRQGYHWPRGETRWTKPYYTGCLQWSPDPKLATR